jgi:glycosyltransferase involved in cell wall biosynthesis
MKPGGNTLVILTPAFPENESATYWVPSQQLMVKSLKENFPELNIIVLAVQYPHHNSTYSWHNVQVISFDGTHKRKLKRLLLWKNIWQTLKNIRRQHNVIGLLSFWCGEAAFFGSHFGKRHGIKHYSWICGQDARETNKWVKFIRPKANELVAMSSSLVREFHKNHGIKPSHIIPNAIVPELFPSSFPQHRDIDLLAVGSLIPLKQFDVFISTVNRLKQDFPNIKAVVCGSGEEKEKLNLLVNKWQLNNNVIMLEATSQETVFELMQRAKLLLHPSSYEGFSTVCLEALYSGAHVISFSRAMDHDIKNWHIAVTEEDIYKKCLALLQNIHLDHERVLLYNMADSAKMFMTLFDQNSSK